MKTLMDVRQSFDSARGPLYVHRGDVETGGTGSALRRAVVLVLLLLSFVLSLSILVRARNEVLLNPPAGHEAATADFVGP